MTTAARPDLIDFPFSPVGTEVPPKVAELRERTPVRRVRTIAGDEAWLVSSYRLARQVLDDDRFSLKDTSAPGVPRQYALTIPPEVVNNMGNITGAGLRKAVLKALSPKAAGLTDWMRTEAERLLRLSMAEGPTLDLRGQFCDPFSAALHCHILGIPQDEARHFHRSLDIAFMNSACPIAGARVNWDRDIGRMKELLDHPDTTGLMRDLAVLRKDPAYGHVTDEMLATVGVTMFGAGVISTSGFLTMSLVTLLTHPELRVALRDDPRLTEKALHEILRVNLSIGDALPRLATENVRLGEVEVEAGELVLVLVEGANFDPEHFVDPDIIDIHRENAADHLSFGGGSHYCPATALGRKHAEIALNTILEHMPHLELAVPIDQLVWRTRFMKRIPERLPVLW
ncbi:cytochrome P450 [Streptomyces sp. ICBB 8177]|uniref:cytochrome P450 n=1 Tax=Streptomyces sp. ICBB 8177 TaxID=563922 RepID=UPI000D67202D|nr:cytochrome P450 [Streptomyces sp. ICBB 8177]PWI45050.1 cytochrome P450 [Streptomyces sp. ICBB 8177]